MHNAARGMADFGVKIKLEYLGNLRDPRVLWNAKHRIQALSKSFDIVHSQYGSACALASSASSVPSVVSIRGNDWNLHDETFGFTWIHTRLARAMTRVSIKSYHAVLCVSERLCKELKSFVHPDCLVEFYPSPIKLAHWKIRTSRRKYPRPPYRLLYTALCPADPIKRSSLLYKALEIARLHLGKIELVCASEIPHSKMPALVASCDAIACTSETEGWPNSIKEALACGLPFVSTDVGDLKSITEISPSCVIANSNPAEFARGICKVLKEPKNPQLREHVKAMDIKALSQKLKTIYNKILKK